MGAGVHFSFGNTLVALQRARFGVVVGGNAPPPPDSAPLVIRPQGAPHLPSNQTRMGGENGCFAYISFMG